MESEEIWAISLDDFVEKAFDFLGRDSDCVGSHYFGYEGEKDFVRQMMLNRIGILLDEIMYPATKYGYPLEDEKNGGE